jgi:hypothetical protein
MLIKNQNVKANKSDRTLKFSLCPNCGRKGLYPVHRQYCRCRYCGHYRIFRPEQDA